MPGIQIGELLMEQGVLTRKQVEHILRVQKISHRPFGDLAERLYAVDPKAIEDAWVKQYLHTVGTVDLEKETIEVEALRRINRRQAWQFQVLPLNTDEDSLNMATTANRLVRSVNFASRKLDEPISFLIAENTQLREFLMKHYPVPEQMAKFAESL